MHYVELQLVCKQHLEPSGPQNWTCCAVKGGAFLTSAATRVHTGTGDHREATPGRVVDVEYVGAREIVHVAVGETQLRAKMAAGVHDLNFGDVVVVTWEPEAPRLVSTPAGAPATAPLNLAAERVVTQ